MFGHRKYRLVLAFFGRPVLPFAVEFVVLAPLVLAVEPGRAAAGYVFALPWLIVLFGIVNLPFFSSMFRSFHLDVATKRNHALEHATIHVLEAGSTKRFSGRASHNGFRVCGPASPKEVRAAFEKVRRSLRDGERLTYVSARCGSNVVTALGLAIGLLLTVVTMSVLLQPPFAVRAGSLLAVVLVFVGLRHGIGNAIQRRFFMAVDFDDVSARDVRGAPQHPMDRGPVCFVETIVRTKKHAV